MDEQSFESINVIPFIDIMLVLLTIVLTTSSFIASGAMDIRLPRAKAGQALLERQVIIEIDRRGQLYFSGAAIDNARLVERLQNHDRATPIIIRADRQLLLQQFVSVMDQLKTLGFNRVSLQTEAGRD